MGRTSFVEQPTRDGRRAEAARRRRLTTALLTVVALALCFPVGARAWEWSVVPYLWMSDIGMDVLINGNAAIGADVDFTDLVEKLDGALSFHFEGRQRTGGFFVDLTLIALSDSSTLSGTGPLPLPPDTRLATDLDLTILEVGGFWRVTGDDRMGFDLLGGVRYIGMDQQIDVTLPAPGEPSIRTGTDEGFTDGFLGARYAGRLGEHWTGRVRIDFGSGDTDGNLNGILGIAYNWGRNQKYGLILAYQRMDLEVVEKSEGERIDTELTMSGPKLGFRITWGN